MRRTAAQSIRRTAVVAAVVDVAEVLVFAAVGRGSHTEEVTALGVLDTAAPFLIGLLVGWLVGTAWRRPAGLSTGATVWASTTVIGLAVRAALTHRLPISFVVVAATALGVFLLGWRAVFLAVAHRNRQTS